MNRESVELGFILKRINEKHFSMDTFGDRLRLQKLIYLLQASGLRLGYDFSWYLRGPYCSFLTRNGYCAEEGYGQFPSGVKMRDRMDERLFQDFLRFVKDKSTDELEISASLHYLKNKKSPMSDETIKERVQKKQKKFTKQQVDKIWDEMKKCGLI